MFMDEIDDFFTWNFRDWPFDEFLTDSVNFWGELENLKDEKMDGDSYSISYHYETGMKEPEITVKGNVDQKTIDKFLGRIKREFGSALLGHSKPDIKFLGNGKDESRSKTVELEMPGIAEHEIKVEIKGKWATITGEHGARKYHKKVYIGFEPTDHSITANEGLIKVEFHRKVEEKKAEPKVDGETPQKPEAK